MKLSFRPRLLIVVAAALVAALGGAVYAVAGHSPSSVPSYTGCLNVGTGKLVKIAVGDAPKSACAGSEVEAHLGGGDITSAIGGIGLLGGATAGSAVLRADPGVVQLRVEQSCGPMRAITAIAQNGTVTCAADDVGFSGYEVVTTTTAKDSVSPKLADAVCPAGKSVIGGGGAYSGTQGQTTRWSSPVGSDRWRMSAIESPPHGTDWQLVVRAICAFTT